jgi:putative tryptophan/tyrosine transport system substrate-binding protein
MRRRDFIHGIAGIATTWPLATQAQQNEQMRRVGVLMNRAANNAEGQDEVAALQQALQELGWSKGRNARIDIRWAENDVDLDRRYAAELVSLSPDVVLAAGALSVAALQRASRTLPDGRRISGDGRRMFQMGAPSPNK